MYATKDQASSDKAQREFKELEIDIVDVIGKVAYQRILREYQRVIAKRLGNKIIPKARKRDSEVVSPFSS